METCKVFFRFSVEDTEFGDQVRVVGDCESLGSWNPLNGIVMTTEDDLFPCWYSHIPVNLPIRKPVKYKYVVTSSMGEKRWEDDEDRILDPTGLEMTVEDDGGLYRRVASNIIGMASQSVANVSAATEHECSPLDVDPEEESKARLKLESIQEQLETQVSLQPNDTVVLVSLQLPVKVFKDDSGAWQIEEDIQAAFLPQIYTWRDTTQQRVLFVGWPGVHVTSPKDQRDIQRLLEEQNCIPIFPPEEDWQEYISFCNSFLWPVFHSVMLFFQMSNKRPWSPHQWACYQRINRLYAEQVVMNSHENDLIWIQNFHLLLCPQYITRRIRRANVGLFLHTPFPSLDIFKCLPVREEMLRGMLCADLVGFQFFEYARHFTMCCKYLLGLEHTFRMGGFLSVEYSGRQVMVRVGHVQVPFKEEREAFEASKIDPATLRADFPDRLIIASLDRCERLSGMMLKVRAFGEFLNKFPMYLNKAVLLLYTYPPGPWGEATAFLEELQQTVKEVNEKLALESNDPTPHIVIRTGEVTRELRMTVCASCDILLDTSIKDGLNLAPFDFLTYRHDPATVILSEFSGCSRVLTGALRVNPWNVVQTSEAIERAITMPQQEREERYRKDHCYVANQSLIKWAEDFLCDLKRARKKEDVVYMGMGFGANFRLLEMDQDFRKMEVEDVLKAYRVSRNRVFFLDNEGTLAADQRYLNRFGHHHLDDLQSYGTPPSSSVLECLNELCKDSRNTVVILSGREKKLLGDWFSSVNNLGLAAESGFYYRVPQITGDEWYCMGKNVDYSWKMIAFELMKQYVTRVQGTFIENKGSALVWQYRDADPDFGRWQAKELSQSLSDLLFGYPVTVVSGKGYVEVRLRGVNKGVAVSKILSKIARTRGNIDFVMCIGDDRSDEDMFEVVNEEMHRCENAEVLSTTSGDGGIITPPSTPPTSGRLSSLMCSNVSHRRLRSLNDKSNRLFSNDQHQMSRYFTTVVGRKPSHAKYFVDDVDDVSEMLRTLALFHNKKHSVGSPEHRNWSGIDTMPSMSVHRGATTEPLDQFFESRKPSKEA